MSGATTEPSAELPHEAHLTALAALDGVGPARLRWLAALGGPAAVWDRLRAGRLPRPPAPLGITSTLLDEWSNQARDIDPALLWRRCEREGLGVVSLGAPGYPPALLGDPDPPVVLFHRGEPDVLAAPRVAVVGTRRATGYGLRVAAELGSALSASGVVVVSGLALGIDAAAHRGAVETGSSPVAAVVGSGLDAPCPLRNRALAARIAVDGVLLSEVPPGVPAAPWRFPVRNRILAALAQVVVVVESSGSGGSMHTVREALDRDRPVMAVPGPIGAASSEGTNSLLADGAHVCRGAEDVLACLGISTSVGGGVRGAGDSTTPAGHPRPEPLSEDRAVLDAVGWRPVSFERLAAASGLGFASLSASVSRLEQDGWLRRDGGWVERVAEGGPVRGSPTDGA